MTITLLNIDSIFTIFDSNTIMEITFGSYNKLSNGIMDCFPSLTETICSCYFNNNNINYIEQFNSFSFNYQNQIRSIVYVTLNYAQSNNNILLNCDSLKDFLFTPSYINHNYALFISKLYDYIHLLLALFLYIFNVAINNIHIISSNIMYLINLLIKCLIKLLPDIKKFFSKLYTYILSLLKKFAINSNKHISSSLKKFTISSNKGINSLLFFNIIPIARAQDIVQNNKTEHALSRNTILGILSITLFVAYVLLNGYYDLRYSYIFGMEMGFNRSYILNRLTLSAIFSILIFIGVTASTCFYLWTVGNSITSMVLGSVLAYSLSYLANIGWLWSGRFASTRVTHIPDGFFRVVHYILHRSASNLFIYIPDLVRLPRQSIISYFRGFCESIAFWSLSWSTFALWEIAVRLSTSQYLLYAYSAWLGAILYFIIGFLQISMEESLTQAYLYGIIYNINFTLLAFSTNGLINLFFSNASSSSRITLGVIAFTFVFVMPMEIYRRGWDNYVLNLTSNSQNILLRYLSQNPRYVRYIARALQITYLYVLFFCFAYSNYFVEISMWFMN